LIFIGFFTLNAEIFSDDNYNFSLDLPEGYSLVDYSADGSGYLLNFEPLNISLLIKINYQEDSSVKKILSQNLTKLNAEPNLDAFKWNDSISAVSNFTINLDQAYPGWGVTCPLEKENNYITVLAYCDKKTFDMYERFIISTINSLNVNTEFYNCPGIIMAYAFPKEGNQSLTLNIENTKITTSIDKSDLEASQFLVDMEYAVLCMYANNELRKEAWQRYYRSIYKDSYSRIEKAGMDIYKSLYNKAKKENPENAPIKYAQYLLSWVQTFDYQRAEEKNSADFTSLPAVLSGKGNDCDSRSLLVALLLKEIGIESLLLISNEYSHAMVATEIEAPGQIYTLPGSDRYFIFGETTAKVTWGMISADFQDQSKWIPVILP
ncbi:MAG: hypothetical protein K5866_07485, partial [Treponema sp.]|nr:hypothetical protein [Treponema sp.]